MMLINPRKKKDGHNEQRASNNVGRPRRTANFCAFSSIKEAFAEKYLTGTVFVIIPLSHGSDSVDQSTDGGCSSNLPGPFQALSTSTE